MTRRRAGPRWSGTSGTRKFFAEAPDRLPGRGTLEVACREGRPWAGVDGKRVVEAKMPVAANEVGAGVTIGGGYDLIYTVERLEVSGALDRAWLEATRGPE